MHLLIFLKYISADRLSSYYWGILLKYRGLLLLICNIYREKSDHMFANSICARIHSIRIDQIVKNIPQEW